MKTVSLLTLMCMLLLVVFSCSKDKFETKPRIEITSYSTQELRPGEVLRIDFDYFDKEGDLDSMYTNIDRQNAIPVAPGDERIHFLNYKLPDFPAKSDGQVRFQLEYELMKECQRCNDSLLFHFRVVDKAGNASDSVTSKMVVLLAP